MARGGGWGTIHTCTMSCCCNAAPSSPITSKLSREFVEIITRIRRIYHENLSRDPLIRAPQGDEDAEAFLGLRKL